MRVFARVLVVQPQFAEERLDARVIRFRRDEAHVFIRAQPRQQARFLEKVGEPPGAAGDAAVLDVNESGDGAQDGGLAAAGGTGEGDAFPGGEVQAEMFDDGLSAEVNLDVVEGEHIQGRRSVMKRRRSGSSRPYSTAMMMATIRMI